MDGINGIGMDSINPMEIIEKLTQKLMEERDENGDGALNMSEVNMPMDLFNKIDTNQDQNLDSEELKNFFPAINPDQMIDRIIEHKDVDGDGMLSAEEMDLPENIFKKLDTNSDGKLDKEELKALANLINGRRMAKDMKSGKGKEDSEETTEEVVSQIDTDGDGKVDTEEVVKYTADGMIASIETRSIGSDSTNII